MYRYLSTSGMPGCTMPADMPMFDTMDADSKSAGDASYPNATVTIVVSMSAAKNSRNTARFARTRAVLRGRLPTW